MTWRRLNTAELWRPKECQSHCTDYNREHGVAEVPSCTHWDTNMAIEQNREGVYTVMLGLMGDKPFFLLMISVTNQ